MKPHKAICNQCDEEKWINNKKGICIDCTYKKNHNGKTPQQVQYEKQKQRPKKQYELKRSTIKYKRKKTGEKELFLEIWNERPHICSNPECKKHLGDEPNAFFFSHIKSKGAYPELRLCKDNIELLCVECHQSYEFGIRKRRN